MTSSKLSRLKAKLYDLKPTRLDGLACILGGLFGSAFPQSSFSGLAWLAPATLFALARMAYVVGDMEGSNAPQSQSHAPSSASGPFQFTSRIIVPMRLGFFWGFGMFLVILSWLRFIPFPAGAAMAWISLSAYLALYLAIWTGWMTWAFPKGENAQPVKPLAPIATQPELEAISRSSSIHIKLWSNVARLPWGAKALWALEGAMVWTAIEWFYGHFITGFPWTFLATTQYQLAPLIQISSCVGIYGVSFLIVWLSLSLFNAAATILGSPGQLGWRWAPDLAPAAVTVLALFLWGANRIGSQAEPWNVEISDNGNHQQSYLNIVAIQPSIPQSLLWDPDETSSRFDRLIELSEQAVTKPVDLILWPESALLGMELEMYEAISDFALLNQVWMAMGVEDAEIKSGEITSENLEWNVYNAAALIDPSGRFDTIYRKRHLVIFGEYVPLSEWIPPLRYLTPIEGGFQRGSQATAFVLETSQGVTWNIQPLICFEDVLPDLTRESLKPETDFVVNFTNDGWFGEASGHWQHWANATFRAVENGVPVLQCGNNGLTAWVDPLGRTHGLEFDSVGDGKNLYAEGLKRWRIPGPQVDSRITSIRSTNYRKNGDRFVAVIACSALGLAVIRRWRSR